MIQSRLVNGRDLRASRRRRSRRIAAGAVAVAAFAAGTIVGLGAREHPEQRVAARYVAAWERGDWAGMWALTGGPRRPSLATFASRQRAAEATATVTRIRFGRPRRPHAGVVAVPAVIRTRLWGTLRETLRLPVRVTGGTARVTYGSQLVFPGLARGEPLRRETTLPPRAALLFRDRTPLAEGPQRSSPFPAIAASIAGTLGPIPADRGARLRALGVPADAQVGLSGLERVFDGRLRGRPGGLLFAGRRVLASRPAREAPALRTTISPKIQSAAAAALAGRLGGAIAIKPRTGEILGAAGIAWSALQPPGSTFKIVTVTGVLSARLASPSTTFPVQTEATLSGVKLTSANGAAGGGTLVEAFAVSCNSVFAPLGARLGATRLVATARRFGFDEPPGIPGAATSTLPDPEAIGDDLAVGSSAIGQGRVDATTLEMALVAATIATDGRRPRPTLVYGERRPSVRAVSPHVARTVGKLMRAVVQFGTGTAAALPGIPVAGKTGTAELKSTVVNGEQQPPPPETGATQQDTKNTDAWFVAFAPARHHPGPRVVVAVMLVQAGAGGDTAAPAARGLLEAALAGSS